MRQMRELLFDICKKEMSCKKNKIPQQVCTSNKKNRPRYMYGASHIVHIRLCELRDISAI